MQSLENKKVIVLGGSRGIGFATAHMADKAGGCVTIGSRGEKSREEALKQLGDKATGIAIDLLDLEKIPAALADTEVIDHLIILPAAAELKPFSAISVSEAQTHFQQSVLASWVAMQNALPKMPADGSITLVTGALSRRPQRDCAHIISAQWAMEGLMKGLVEEIKPRRINTIVPGLVDTSFWDRLPPASKQDLFEATAARVPLGRVATAEDIAHMILSTMQNPYTTGSTIVVDGGWSV